MSTFLWVSTGTLDIDVGYPSAFGILRQSDIVRARIRILRNNIPGMKKAREISKAAEENVDQRISGKNSGFDPD
jgi:hypothetical protein